MLFTFLFIFVVSMANHASSTSSTREGFRSLTQKKLGGHPSRRTIVVPIMLHIDKSLRRKLAKDNIQVGRMLRKFASRLLMDTQKNLVGLTGKYDIKLKLLKARSLRNSNFTKMVGDASTYLKNYCNWQSYVKWTKNLWHYSILLTGLDIYYFNAKGKKITASTGRAYTNGMCSLTKSCSIVEWRPDRAAHHLAHELAHSLGVNHDGPPKNECKPGDRNIMSARYKWSGRQKVWSACSKRDFNKYITSRRSRCLFCEGNRRLTTKRRY